MAERFRLIPAVHLFLIRDQQILLLRRANTGFADGLYSVPAGHLDGGEEVKAAAIREAGEEIGVEIRPEELAVVGVMHRLSDTERVDFFVAADRWYGTIYNAEPDKCDDLRWCHLDSLPEDTVPYVRQAITNYRSGIWFDSFGWS